MFDITSQAAIDTTAVHLKGRDGEFLYTTDGKPVQIVIYGPSSKQFSVIEARQTNRVLKRMNDNDGKHTAVAPEQRAAEQAEDLAELTVSFENLAYPPAGTLKGKELFQALYADSTLGFIPPQIIKAMKDWGNFKPGSTGN
ncbi:hypothetical protein [Sphingobium sp. YR768]|uniref:hypothetical protein n=1 Tax=Sphingobium sp. YR768 TaxID=1884365 RepID=UPI0008B16235|nr:hypothetical protein [Sphingobium sp. YR768]SEQ60549.1 hypothetical protein SAMN05518866_101495 [Sphingobium sp. YR768]